MTKRVAPHWKLKSSDQRGRAELNEDRERLSERVVTPAEEILHQQQMSGRRHRQEFGEAFDDAEDRRLEQVQMG